MDKYYFDDKGRFIIENYNNTKPFSNFLPGIAGILGIPMWVFYVNRGQGIASFGVKDKNSPIMEFFPANKSYQNVPYIGFRTFIKIKEDNGFQFYEPFSPINRVFDTFERMLISKDRFQIEERIPKFALETNVCYYTAPNEEFPGLIRRVRLENKSTKSMKIELLDGLPIVIPNGINQEILKGMSYTGIGWMVVTNLAEKIPFYTVSSTVGDETRIEKVKSGHFYFSFLYKNSESQLLNPIVDPSLIFGENTSFSYPDNFINLSLDNILKSKQITSNKLPCGFFGIPKITLLPQERVEILSLIGLVNNVDLLNSQKDRLVSKDYFDKKLAENAKIISSITKKVYTCTDSEIFDSYCHQTFLDNTLRGGFPYIVERHPTPNVIHLFLRKHGDLERDYNWFYLEDSFFSQGNANYRDVNQNRRCDVRLNPRVKHFNILTFMNLIQSDGYNPLVLQGSKFEFDYEKLEEILKFVDKRDKIAEFLQKPFTLGGLTKFIINTEVNLDIALLEFVKHVLKNSIQEIEAVHGEGFWVDHWTYNLDLIEDFLSIYPDKRDEILFNEYIFTYYDNATIVRPRNEKYALINGKVRQIHSVTIDKEKLEIINSRNEFKNITRVNNGKGSIYKSNLFSKLLSLIINKFSLLDPWGMGIEMEADKPGWYDALNGMPGIFGSSIPETFELKRLIIFMLDVIVSTTSQTVKILKEIYTFITIVKRQVTSFLELSEEFSQFKYWDRVSIERERFREKTKFGFLGAEESIELQEIKNILESFLVKIDEGISRALEINSGKLPTYFFFEVKDYELLYDNQNKMRTNETGFPLVKIKQFKPQVLPLFLEGFVRALKVQKTKTDCQKIWKQVRESDLYDKKLRMYKLNASLENQPVDIGRAKAFTPGWLENESIWLHMEYKFLLEVLKAGLYEEFFNDFRNIFIPFLDANRYGRNLTENSSFLVSSAFPDEDLHGTGFYARLSGATAEFINIWFLMMVGENPFYLKGNQLCLEFKPIIPEWLFDNNNCISFNFLGDCTVTIHNPQRLDTFDDKASIKEIILKIQKNEQIIKNNIISDPYSSQIRSGKVDSIDIYYY